MLFSKLSWSIFGMYYLKQCSVSRHRSSKRQLWNYFAFDSIRGRPITQRVSRSCVCDWNHSSDNELCEKKKRKLFSKADFATILQALEIGIAKILSEHFLKCCFTFLIISCFHGKNTFIWILNICCIYAIFLGKNCTKEGIIGKLAATIFNLLHEIIFITYILLKKKYWQHGVLWCSYWIAWTTKILYAYA